MAAHGSARASLSTRVTLLTAVVLSVAASVIAVICVAGVYNMARTENDARLVAYRQLMLDDLMSRLTIADRMAEALVGTVEGAASDRTRLERDVSQSAAANVEYFDLLMVTDAKGNVLAVAPGDTAVPNVAGTTFFATRASHDAYFAWYEPPGETPSLWVVRRVGRSPSGMYVVGRLRVGFMARIVDDIAQSRASVSALIVDGEGHPVRAGVGNVAFSPAAIAYSKPAQDGRGTASVESSSTGPLTGHYATVGPVVGLDWRVVVLETERDAMSRSWNALLPAGVAALCVALFAIGFVVVYSRRLVAPLRELERRAHDVAAGGHVRALQVERHDEIGRLADAFNEVGVRLNSLQDMAELLASTSSLADMLDSVLNAVGHILGTGDVAILLTEEGAPALTLARGRGLALPAATFLVPLDERSPVSEAYHRQEPVTFVGSSEEGTASLHRLFGAEGPRAGAAVPLIIGTQVLGVIVVLAPNARPFTEAQTVTLRAFSANAAVAVHNSRLFEEERVSRRQAEALREVAELIVRPTDLADALELAAAVAADLLGKESWAFGIEGRDQLGLREADDDEAEDRRYMEAWRVVTAAGGLDPETRSEPVEVEDVAAIEGLAELLGPEAGSALFIPLVQGSLVRCVLVVLGRERRPAPMPRRVLLAGTIGKELSLAIRNAYLFRQARSRAANLETVFRISQAVSSELQLNVVLNRVLDVVQKIFSADAVALMLHDAQRNIIATSMARGMTSRDLLYFQVRPGEDIPGEVFQARTPAAHGDLERLSTPLAHLALEQGLHSLIVVPLLARGKSIGVLSVLACQRDAFSGEDVDLMLTFATQAALAIDTASLYGKEHHVASILQGSILPERLPHVSGIETATFYLPVGPEAEIGGDYYDVFRTGDGRIVLAIADVCGKGVLAATKTSMVKYSLRGLVSAGAGPAAALFELNRLVALSGDPSDIVTAWVGILDLRAHTLVYANGGHPPGLLWTRGSEHVESLAPTGPLLGAVPGVAYAEHEVPAHPGDMLLLYTDGVTEARQGSQFFGEERIREVLRAGENPTVTLELLLAAIKGFSAGPLRDDAAALLIRLTGEDE